MLGAMIRKADSFTGTEFLLREDTPEYLAGDVECGDR